MATKTLATTLVPGTSYVVYVEGDQVADFDRNTSIEDFAKRNQGNYVVVVIELGK